MRNFNFDKLKSQSSLETEYVLRKNILFPPIARQPLGGLGRLIFRRFTITPS
jgi:hypothetical protein